jgi:hypothetical protein
MRRIMADDSQRNDPELRAAVKAELYQLNKILTEAKAIIESAVPKLEAARKIDEDTLNNYSHSSWLSNYREATIDLYSAIRHFSYKVDKPTEAYIGNVAAFMTPENAKLLKEKHNESMDIE